MMRRARKFSAAYCITSDERGKVAEELMASIDGEPEELDEDEPGYLARRTSDPPRYAADEESPVSEDRWDHAPLRVASRS